MKESTNNWVSRLHRRTKKRADQFGVTLQEVLIGIAVAAVVAAGAIFLGPRFIGQGQRSAGQNTLNVAVAAVNSTYANVLEGGQQNFASRPQSHVATTGTGNRDVSTTISESPASNAWSAAAAHAFNNLGESIEFIPVVEGATACTCRDRGCRNQRHRRVFYCRLCKYQHTMYRDD